MHTEPISVNELKNAFFSIQTNKCPEHEIYFNVMRGCSGEVCEALQYLFSLSFEERIPGRLKNSSKITPLFEAVSNTELINYRPISVLPCLFKILKRVMYNHLYKYLLDSSIPYNKQFDLQEGHSIDHAVLQLFRSNTQQSQVKQLYFRSVY